MKTDETGRMEWRSVRLPVGLARRLDRRAAALLKSHIEGRLELPTRYVDNKEKVPLYFVIELALNEYEARRERSRRRSGPRLRDPSRHPAEPVATGEERVYIVHRGEADGFAPARFPSEGDGPAAAVPVAPALAIAE